MSITHHSCEVNCLFLSEFFSFTDVGFPVHLSRVIKAFPKRKLSSVEILSERFRYLSLVETGVN